MCDLFRLELESESIEYISDIVVGAYLSDSVVVLLGQPVIELNASMEILNTLTNTSTRYIEKDAKNLTVRVCFQYSHADCSSMGNFIYL